MQWEKLETEKLLSLYQAIISSDVTINNRFIGFLGLFQTNALAKRAEAWVLKDSIGKVKLLVAETNDELIPLVHSMFPLTPDVVQSLRENFTLEHLVTLHAQQCEEWERAIGAVQGHCQARMEMWLYTVNRLDLRRSMLPAGLDWRKVRELDAHVSEFIRGFSQEIFQRTVSDQALTAAFARNDYYGLYQGSDLLSLAAATRQSLGSRCISYVYTPPSLRGRGYAQVSVGALTQSLLEAGRFELVFLYADVKNASSNRVYEQLGFRKLCRSSAY